MEIMNFLRFGKRALSLSLLLAIFTVSSMVTLATSAKPVGELIVKGGNSDAAVTVNGEPATSGRTVFAASTITTPNGVSAVLNLGKAGKIELKPNTTFVLWGDGAPVGGSLTAGDVVVLNSTEPVGVKTMAGETLSLSAGETVSAGSTAAAKAQTKGPGGIDWWIWGVIIGGGIAAIIIAANAGDDNNNISPIR